MNVLQIFVTKIHSAERVCKCGICRWVLVADTDCWGRIEEYKTIYVDDEQYEHIKKYGYYWG